MVLYAKYFLFFLFLELIKLLPLKKKKTDLDNFQINI